ncbi:hypothetical protein F5B18DRAFT_616889 [Nemania serpens]|nr:hypothetical protein F5B18DRAFT_616889 [Nemania serpens]
MCADAGSHREDASGHTSLMNISDINYSQVIRIPYLEDMQFDTFITKLMIFGAVPSASALPLHRRSAPSRPLDNSTCEFYGYVDDKGVFNEYTIDMAGWGNDGSASTCEIRVPNYIQAQCNTGLDNFICNQHHENHHDTQISFRINKAAISQPDCVSEALRLASLFDDDEQNVECLCLAECWPSQISI